MKIPAFVMFSLQLGANTHKISKMYWMSDLMGAMKTERELGTGIRGRGVVVN